MFVSPDSVRTVTVENMARVLIIEDDVDAGESLHDLLEATGHTCRVEHSGARGITAGRQFRPDVILCDLSLPDLSGFEVATRVRRDPVFSGVRLIATSGYGEAAHIEAARRAGFDAHLTKPFDVSALLRHIPSFEGASDLR